MPARLTLRAGGGARGSLKLRLFSLSITKKLSILHLNLKFISVVGVMRFFLPGRTVSFERGITRPSKKVR
ncbi:MAG: hypothetical protein IRD7MM_02200 [Candidatus Midichloria mitochondrii]|uniref:Uncharacterized protein n=1 Tax=Midichloria mitochondrii (strain IricVA) TaxID=696127 RepID=F7XWM1_MIDMI|nr:hypothetical protein midi_00780 [Candidatus Midichloria mitochondrii IricVA]